MTKARIQVKKRYDKEVAEAGVDFHIVDQDTDIDFGTYRMKHIDQFSQKYNAAIADKGRIARMKLLKDHERIPHILLDFSLIGWSGIEYEDGKNVPFSREEALEYLCHEDNTFLLSTLWSKCTDPSNYQKLDVAEITKN